MSSRCRAWLGLALTIALSAVPAVPGMASAIHYVTSDADTGPGSLREAIAAAVAGDSIVVETAGPIELQSSLRISTPLSISGAATRTILDGSRIGDGEVIQVDGVEAVFERCVVRDNDNEGGSFGSGGGVIVGGEGHATLMDCIVSGNRGQYGGGITVWGGMLTLRRTEITGNSATGPGGGVFVYLGGLNASDCTISANTAESGGGIYHRSEGASSAIRRCVISGNTATLLGGALVCSNTGPTTVEDSVILGNSCLGDGGGVYTATADLVCIRRTEVASNLCSGSGGGLSVGGYVWIEDCAVTGNVAREGGGGIDSHGWIHVASCLIKNNTASYGGGGICNVQGLLTVSATTIAYNAATRGGGLEEVEGTAVLSNCTVSGNEALENGGGIWNSGWALVGQCTIAANVAGQHGGGIYNVAFVPITSSIAALNHAPAGNDVSGGLRSRGWNLIGDTTGCEGELLPTDIRDVDPLLNALASVGGCLPSHNLLAGSPAVDAGSCIGIDGSPVTADQCGNLRPLGRACDIGAVEAPPSGVDVPAPPHDLVVTGSSHSEAALKWQDGSDDEEGFNIERRIPDGIYSHVGTAGPDVTAYSDTGLASATTYCYRVSAFNDVGNSDYSNESCATTQEECTTCGNGDANGDGAVDVLDVRLCLQIATGVVDAPLAERAAADVDGDGDVDSDDVRILAEYLIGLRSTLP